MKSAIARMFRVLSGVTVAVVAIWVIILDVKFLAAGWGFWGVVAGFFVAPVAAVVIPLYAGFAYGDWDIAVVILVGSVLGLGLFGLAELADPSA